MGGDTHIIAISKKNRQKYTFILFICFLVCTKFVPNIGIISDLFASSGTICVKQYCFWKLLCVYAFVASTPSSKPMGSLIVCHKQKPEFGTLLHVKCKHLLVGNILASSFTMSEND